MKSPLSRKLDFSSYRLLAPGPVQLSDRVREELSRPMIHHRTPLFAEIFNRTLRRLQYVFQTREPVFIMSATGSGGMEAALSNTLSPGDEVLVIVSGKFGERWAEMSESFGLKTTRLNVPWGEAIQLDRLAEALQRQPKLKAVMTQLCETSTAVLHPVREISRMVNALPQPCLMMVDAITGIGATPLRMDEWGIDVVVAGSQKAFMLPTGLAFVSLSGKAWEFYVKSKSPKYYFDLGRERRANEDGESFVSASVSLIRALDVVLEDFQTRGLEALHERSRRLMRATHRATEVMGLGLFSTAPSPSLTAISVPPSIDGQKWRGLIEKSYNVTLMGGQDRLKGKILRIGHLGAISDEDQLHALAAIGLSAIDLGWSSLTMEKVDLALATADQALRTNE